MVMNNDEWKMLNGGYNLTTGMSHNEMLNTTRAWDWSRVDINPSQ